MWKSQFYSHLTVSLQLKRFQLLNFGKVSSKWVASGFGNLNGMMYDKHHLYPSIICKIYLKHVFLEYA